MDSSLVYLRELSGTLFRYHQENFLCDVVIVTAEQSEVRAHSVVLASVSSKLRAAFEQSNSANVKKNYLFRLHLAECEASVLEILLQYIYTGTIMLYTQLTMDIINNVILASQKLGLNMTKIVACIGVMLQLAGITIQESFPYVLKDEDVLLEIIERGSELSVSLGKEQPLEIIKVTSKLRSRSGLPGSGLDHSYTHDSENKMKKRLKPDAVLESQPDHSDFAQVASVSEHLRLVSEVVDAVACKEEASESEVSPDLPGSCEEEGYVDNIEDQQYSATYEAEFVPNPDPPVPECVYVKQETLLQETSQDEQNFIRDVIARTMVGELDGASADYVPEIVEPSFSGGVEVVQVVQTKSKKAPTTRKFGRGASRSVKAKVIHQCNTCHKSFKTYPEYADHHRTHTGEKPYVCDICGKAFGRSYTATEHRRLHTGERPYQCDTCGKRFITAGDLGKHKRLHTGEKPYKCKICGKEMSTGRENADHRRLHEGGNECPMCGKKFTRLHNMKEHMNGAHHGVKRYSCSICSKQFSYSCSLRYHKRLHQEDKSIKCETCGKCFARFGELTRHERTAHKPEVLEIDDTAGGLTFAN